MEAAVPRIRGALADTTMHTRPPARPAHMASTSAHMLPRPGAARLAMRAAPPASSPTAELLRK